MSKTADTLMGLALLAMLRPLVLRMTAASQLVHWLTNAFAQVLHGAVYDAAAAHEAAVQPAGGPDAVPVWAGEHGRHLHVPIQAVPVAGRLHCALYVLKAMSVAAGKAVSESAWYPYVRGGMMWCPDLLCITFS